MANSSSDARHSEGEIRRKLIEDRMVDGSGELFDVSFPEGSYADAPGLCKVSTIVPNVWRRPWNRSERSP